MPRININLNKSNQHKLDSFIKKHKRLFSNESVFENDIRNLVISENKNIKDCNEPHIVESYIGFLKNYVDGLEREDDGLLIWNTEVINDYIKPSVRVKLAAKYTNKTFDNTIDIYFNEVKREYILTPQNESDDLEFLPENKDIFIKNNLKLVVNCAKRYRGLGLDFEDLIQAGNLGLLIAFDKFDNNRANLRHSIYKNIDKFITDYGKDTFSIDECTEIITNSFEYDKDLPRTLKLLPSNGFESVEDFKNWVKKNVKTAVFASVAFQWIRATILNEIGKATQIVHIPKSQVQEGINPCKNHHMVFIDELNMDDSEDTHVSKQKFQEFESNFMEDEVDPDDLSKTLYIKKYLYELMDSLSSTERRMIKKYYGISLPCAMTFQEIANSEGLQLARVKYIINQATKKMMQKVTPEQRVTMKNLFASI